MRISLILLAFGVACSSNREPESAPTPVRRQPAAKRVSSAAPTARPVVGSYRFAAVNKDRVPAEFPAGSGARLESGTLELRSNKRFAMRFLSRVPGGTAARVAGDDGKYRIGRDTLYFYVDNRATRPVTFRFLRTSDGLRLIDKNGNTWAYVRR